ncbi:hypothetical protein [Sphaerotilus mobilis]|uniref:Uncharacterized protein n=1 Tax=Sphaerotilus mobilis TaxID=47994 RepID=A0A4Q7LQY3_9BURK|nr:hypothetical protein [Sphaerotilus mobilis]RZS57124.1 hypothetical protein EV685_1688 [Sphaerotilus mobilis]
MVRVTNILMVPAVLLALAGCQNKPIVDPNAKPEIRETRGAILMPAGASYRLVQLAEKGIKPRIYTQVRGMGDPSNEKLLFRADVAAAIGVTATQIQRRFMDTVGKTKRYEVYDTSTSVTAEASDFVVDAQFVGSSQELRTLEGGLRVAVTRVQLNANLIDRYSGRPVWAAPVEAVGVTGLSSSDRMVVQPGESLEQADVQRRLGIDYERAMQRAFDRLAARIDSDLRPMGKVVGVEGDGISIIGGQRNGLQSGDEMVIFSAGLTTIGEAQSFINMRPLAAVRCSAVGQETSQCDVVRRNTQFNFKEGDFVILTDHSASTLRQGM